MSNIIGNNNNFHIVLNSSTLLNEDKVKKINSKKDVANIHRSINLNIQKTPPLLLPINKKIFSNASITRKGLNRPDEPLKINQDNLFKVKFGDINFSYYGVCDGHGPNGQYVSEYIKSNLPIIVYSQLKNKIIQSSKEKKKNQNIITNNNNNNNDSNTNINTNINEFDISSVAKELFRESFSYMEMKLLNNESIETELSGTTCISVLFCTDKIITANVGDSRAIKGKCLEDNKWEYELLSRDHKPSEKDEAERIYNSNGEVHPFKDEEGNFVGPDRVWILNKDLPGLAMSRSFGDQMASKAGVVSVPEVKIFPYKKEDKFVVIASDGLWEYVSNEEVLEIVSYYLGMNDCDGAVSKLYEISRDRWTQYDEYIDDITIIVIFLD